jgi:GxxExxY protein
MPITIKAPIRRLSQQEFGELSYEVMRHVFDIHNELGRFFDERIYKRELAHRLANVRLEVPIDLSFESFRATLFLDALVENGGIFEFKATERISAAHRAQLLQYLMLCDLSHGKLINVRPEKVEDEFVNTTLRHADRSAFAVDSVRWNPCVAGGRRLQEYVVALLSDWGVGLQIPTYEAAVVHYFGQPVETDVGVAIDGRQVGTHRVALFAPGVMMMMTGLTRGFDRFEIHARRLLAHLDVRAIAWININPQRLTFTTLEK